MFKFITKAFIQIGHKLLKNYLIQKHQQFLKFCLVGILGTIIDIGILYILVEFAHFNYLLAASLSFVLAVINNYLFNKYWTFKNTKTRHLKQFSLFLLISLVGLAINLGILYLLVDLAQIWYIFAKIIAILIVTIWNFIMNKFVTFKP